MWICWLHLIHFSCKKVSNASKCLTWVPSFLRNKRDTLAQYLHILDVASSNITANWGLIINAYHVLLISFIYDNLFHGLLFVIFSKQIISSGMIKLEKQREKKPVITHVSGHTKRWWRMAMTLMYSTVNPWHEHTWLFHEFTLLVQPQRAPTGNLWSFFQRCEFKSCSLWTW